MAMMPPSHHEDVVVGERQPSARRREPDRGCAADAVDAKEQRAVGVVVDDPIVRILRGRAHDELIHGCRPRGCTFRPARIPILRDRCHISGYVGQQPHRWRPHRQDRT
jgi:hypothetical protein